MKQWRAIGLAGMLSALMSGAGSAQSPSAAGAPLYAEIHRDCAPWDGSAFTVSIQPLAGVKQIKPPTLHISIWQDPNLPSGGRFQFPDNTGKVGAVYVEPAPERMTIFRGSIAFVSVTMDTPVEGQFDLTDSSGKRYAGKFLAKWTSVRAMCGG
jgi:hypothetical protein